MRQVFQRARNSVPCIIFFDEFDALCPRRSGHGDAGATDRIVNQLLTEMDGVELSRRGVFLMAATNRHDMIDPAVMRPGRFDKTLYVGFPKPADRVQVLRALTKVPFLHFYIFSYFFSIFFYFFFFTFFLLFFTFFHFSLLVLLFSYFVFTFFLLKKKIHFFKTFFTFFLLFFHFFLLIFKFLKI